MKYPFRKAKEGEWIQPRLRNYLLSCCDCGLVHKMDFVIVTSVDGTRQGIQFRAFRDDKQTAKQRRAMERAATRRSKNGTGKHRN